MNTTRDLLLTAWLLWGGLSPGGPTAIRQALAAEDDAEADAGQAAADGRVDPRMRRQFRRQQPDVNAWLGLNDSGQSERRLKRQLAEFSRAYDLTVAQQEKLNLAASVDNKRFFDDVDIVRLRVSALGEGGDDPWAVQKQIRDLRQRFVGGLHDEKSLFIKTLRRILLERRQSAPEEPVTELMRRHYRSAVEINLAALAEELKLTDEQHAALVELVLRETRPPHLIGVYEPPQILLQLATLPPEKVNRLLTDQQHEQLNQRLAPYRLVAPSGSDDVEQVIQGVIAKFRRAARGNSEYDQ